MQTRRLNNQTCSKPAALSEASDGEAATGGSTLDESALHPWPLLGVELAHLVPYLLGEEPRPPLLPVPRHPGLPAAVHPQPRRARQVLAAVAGHSSHNPHVLYAQPKSNSTLTITSTEPALARNVSMSVTRRGRWLCVFTNVCCAARERTV
jgi:hypothetical protein